MSIIKFSDLKLSQCITKATEDAGYTKPTPIQLEAIPAVLEGGDIFGCAQTGTGKTAAFVLPILEKLLRGAHTKQKEFRALILAPTRELVEQINSSITTYGKHANLSHAKVYGGVPQGSQVRALEKGVDILIATPGRLLDLYKQKKFTFKGVEIFVLDEADRMLDMGFINDIMKITSYLPDNRQSLLFSATLSQEVQMLASKIVRSPKKISISPEKPTVEKIDQRLYFVSDENKVDLMKHLIDSHLEKDENALTLVFCRTKHGANKVVKKLLSAKYKGEVIHGNKSQSARQRALNEFKDKKCKVLVATDIAARGIDVKGMSLVINYDLPEEPETYIHRIGRTARAEASGEAASFFTTSDFSLLRSIERIIRKKIAIADENPFHSQAAEDVYEGKKKGDQRKHRARGAQNTQPSGGKREKPRHSPDGEKAQPRRKKEFHQQEKGGGGIKGKIGRIFGHFARQKKKPRNRGGR